MPVGLSHGGSGFLIYSDVYFDCNPIIVLLIIGYANSALT